MCKNFVEGDSISDYENRFDLWEEVESKSFYTTAVQHRALREGAILAKELGETKAAARYVEQADNLLCFLQVCSIYMPTNSIFLKKICSLTGTPRTAISRQILVVEDQALTPIPR